MRNVVAALIIAVTLASGQTVRSVEYRHLYTFGSKLGIHPPKVLNRRPATVAFGQGEFPYGIAFPTGVTTDHQHRAWITDSATASLHVFDPGSGAYREFRRLDGVALQMPAGIATDKQGRVYMTDSASGGVYVFDLKGEYDRPLISKKDSGLLESPTAIAISENGGTIYVLDPPRRCVIALNREGEAVGRIQLPQELNNPSSIAVVDNQVYVLGGDQHRVEIFSPDGRLRGEQRWESIHAPSAFAWDAGRRRFLVANPRLMVIEIFNEEGQELGAFGQKGEGVDQVQRIDSIYVGLDGFVYVVDSRHEKVLVYSESRQQH